MLPYCDGDVSNQQGQHFIDDSRYAYDDDVLRSTVWVMGANHNFFNTVWTPGKYAYSTSDDWGATSTDADLRRRPAAEQHPAQRGRPVQRRHGVHDRVVPDDPRRGDQLPADVRRLHQARPDQRPDRPTSGSSPTRRPTSGPTSSRSRPSAARSAPSARPRRRLCQRLRPHAAAGAAALRDDQHPAQHQLRCRTGRRRHYAPNVPASPMTKFLWTAAVRRRGASHRRVDPGHRAGRRTQRRGVHAR